METLKKLSNKTIFIWAVIIISLSLALSYWRSQQSTDTYDIWSSAQKRANNAVVQVIVQTRKFDWLKPYDIKEESETQGSAFFINKQGELITNAHVVENAQKVWIHIPALGRKVVDADIISIAPERDIALLSIKPDNLKNIKQDIGSIPYLTLGDSDKVSRTDNVLIVGYPLGQKNLKSATGIVSGHEFLKGHSYIQTTAPVNPGNSGGPLLNEQGNVIGISTAAVTEAQNVGYAIPINELKLILNDLHQKPLLRKPFLGITMNNSSEFQVTFLKNPLPGGIYVNSVTKDSIAQEIGLKEGDMIYSFNNHDIDIYGEARVPWSNSKVPLTALLARINIGTKVPLIAYRNGERKNLSFKLTEPPLYPIRTMYPDYEKIDYIILAGMVIMPANENIINDLKGIRPYLTKYLQPLNKVNPALIITHVLNGSKLYQIHALVSGDIITHINDTEVTTLDELKTALEKGIETNSLQIKAEDKTYVVLPLKASIADDVTLSQIYGYPIENVQQQLLN